MSAFLLPDLGEGLQDAEIVAWHVTAGDHVVAEQPLVSVETDKAVVEIPSPRAGRIGRLWAAAGERIKVGAPLVEFAEGAHTDAGTVVGELTASPSTAPRAAPATAPAAASAVKASPAVRARARALGVDLSRTAASGTDGTLTLGDVEAAAAGPGIAGAKELRGVRRAMALNMRRAGHEGVPATVSDDADIGGWSADADITARLIRAIVRGCRASPALNAWYDGTRLALRRHQVIDLGIAVDTDDGLIVPVLRDVGGRDAAGLRHALDALHAAVLRRSVPLADLRGPTFSLSNFGTLAGRYAALAIVPPQVAILGAGRARTEIRALDGKAVPRRVLPLSLTFDHRAVTGGEAARFLGAVIADLEAGT